MTIDEVKMLADLKKFYEQEARMAYESGMEDPQSYLDSITDKFELSRMQLRYLNEGILSEEQTNDATMALYNKVKAMASTTPVERK